MSAIGTEFTVRKQTGAAAVVVRCRPVADERHPGIAAASKYEADMIRRSASLIDV
jgi:hypothetical protein